MKEIIKSMENMFNKRAPIARLFGMTLTFDNENNAVITLPYNPDLDHALGATHGGVYATMLDTVGWFTVAVRMSDPKLPMVTTEMSMHFLRPVQKQQLKAHAKMLKQGSSQNIAEMFLYDENEKLVGHATATFMQLENKRKEICE